MYHRAMLRLGWVVCFAGLVACSNSVKSSGASHQDGGAGSAGTSGLGSGGGAGAGASAGDASTGGAGAFPGEGGLVDGGTSDATDAPACQSPLTACGSQCVDITSDAANCGGCGHACGANDTCVNQVCTPCPFTICSGVCVDTSSDTDACGSCWNFCPPPQGNMDSVICQAGQCYDCCGDSSCLGQCTPM